MKLASGNGSEQEYAIDATRRRRARPREPIGRLTRDAKKEKQGHGTRTAQEPHAARVPTFSGVVDRREALAVPLVHVGARVDQGLEARGVGPRRPVLGLRLLRARDELQVALIVNFPVLDAVPQLHLPLDHAHLDAGHDEGLALVRRRANLAQLFREPASGVASMASPVDGINNTGSRPLGRVVGELGRHGAREVVERRRRGRELGLPVRDLRIARLDGVPRTDESRRWRAEADHTATA